MGEEFHTEISAGPVEYTAVETEEAGQNQSTAH